MGFEGGWVLGWNYAGVCFVSARCRAQCWGVLAALVLSEYFTFVFPDRRVTFFGDWSPNFFPHVYVYDMCLLYAYHSKDRDSS